MEKCNDTDCLNCKLVRCKYDIEDRQEYVRDIMRRKDKVRHARYYLENKDSIDAKQKEYDKTFAKETWDRYYAKNKDRVQARNRAWYEAHKEEQQEKALERYYANRDAINERRRERYRLRSKEGVK